MCKMLYVLLVLGFASRVLLGFEFDIQINGRSSNRTIFCAGEDITLMCIGKNGAYSWTIPMFSVNLAVTAVTFVSVDPMQRFIARRLSTERSSLNFTAFSELNGSNITCTDGGSGSILSSLEVEIFGPPSLPSVNIQTRTLPIILSVSSTGPSEDCVQSFTANISFLNILIASQTVPASAGKIIFERVDGNEENYTIDVVATDFIGRTSETYSDNITVLTSSLVTTTEEIVATSMDEVKHSSVLSESAIIGIVLAFVMAVILLGVIIIMIIFIYKSKYKSWSLSNSAETNVNKEMTTKSPMRNKVAPAEDQIPLYQDEDDTQQEDLPGQLDTAEQTNEAKSDERNEQNTIGSLFLVSEKHIEEESNESKAKNDRAFLDKEKTVGNTDSNNSLHASPEEHVTGLYGQEVKASNII